ncbi:hypothetical protein L209DRAFT_314526 [Thermothelomyces heterothallicus CBS 203.75]
MPNAEMPDANVNADCKTPGKNRYLNDQRDATVRTQRLSGAEASVLCHCRQKPWGKKLQLLTSGQKWPSQGNWTPLLSLSRAGTGRWQATSNVGM